MVINIHHGEIITLQPINKLHYYPALSWAFRTVKITKTIKLAHDFPESSDLLDSLSF